MNLLLNVFVTFWNNLLVKLSTPAVIFALAFAILGVALAFIARRVAVVCRKTDDIDDKDPIMIGFKAAGLACLFVSVLIIVIRAGV
jgi:hypothetical protein